MRANILLVSGLLVSLAAGTDAVANDDIVVLQVGTPAESQKSDVFFADVKYHHMFGLWGESGCQPGLGARAGILDVGHESGARLGAGARVECQWNQWVVWMPFEVLWLSKHEFGQRGDCFKDYGGPVQLSTGLGLGYAFTRRWLIGYQYEHMSNGHMYEPNPALDSHTLHLEYRF